jgi:predicted dehydrogenase
MAGIRFGIVGCGLIGQKRLLALPKGSVVAVCDLSHEKAALLAASAGGKCLATTHLEELLAAKPDAVVVAVMNRDLATVAAECIRAGIHVLVEKPVATTVSQIDDLIALSQQHRVIVRAGYNHRYHPGVLTAREIVDSDSIGPLMFVRARYGHGGRTGYDREWRADALLSGGGELIDQGVHLIDLASWFLGPLTLSAGHIATYYWDMPVEDNAFLLLQNGAGNTAFLHASCTEWKNLFSFEIYGRNGKLHIEGLGGSYGVERLYHYRMLPEMGPPETVIYEYPQPDSSWIVETRAFIDDIRLSRSPRPGLPEARAALEIVENTYSRQNRTMSASLAR